MFSARAVWRHRKSSRQRRLPDGCDGASSSVAGGVQRCLLQPMGVFDGQALVWA